MSTFLMVLLNEFNDGEFLIICDRILLRSEGPSCLSEHLPKVTVSDLATKNSLTLKLYTQLLYLMRLVM